MGLVLASWGIQSAKKRRGPKGTRQKKSWLNGYLLSFKKRVAKSFPSTPRSFACLNMDIELLALVCFKASFLNCLYLSPRFQRYSVGWPQNYVMQRLRIFGLKPQPRDLDAENGISLIAFVKCGKSLLPWMLPRSADCWNVVVVVWKELKSVFWPLSTSSFKTCRSN